MLDLDNTLIHAYPSLPPPDAFTLFEKEYDFQVVTPNCPDLMIATSTEKWTRSGDESVGSRAQDILSSKAKDKRDLAFPHYFEDPLRPEVEEAIRRWESWAIFMDRFLPSMEDMSRLNLDPRRDSMRESLRRLILSHS